MSFNQIPPNPAVLIEQLTMIIDEATDKAAVKQSIKARLNAAAQMTAPADSNMSTMDTDIDHAIEPYEADADFIGEVASRMSAQLEGGRRRKTRRRGGNAEKRLEEKRKEKERLAQTQIAEDEDPKPVVGGPKPVVGGPQKNQGGRRKTRKTRKHRKYSRRH